MGSVTSKPKVTAASPVARQAMVVGSSPVVAIGASPEEISKIRIENILRRSRSAIGNIMTGFRGILTGNQAVPQRKSLLGE